MSFLSEYWFVKIVDKYNAEHKSKTLSFWQQFLAMSFNRLHSEKNSMTWKRVWMQ